MVRCRIQEREKMTKRETRANVDGGGLYRVVIGEEGRW